MTINRILSQIERLEKRVKRIETEIEHLRETAYASLGLVMDEVKSIKNKMEKEDDN